MRLISPIYRKESPIGKSFGLYGRTFVAAGNRKLYHVMKSNCVATFKVRQVRGIRVDGKIFTELLGCLACLYSWVGEPHILQAVCLSACLMPWPLFPIVAPIVAPVPLRVSHHHRPQQGVSVCLSTRGEQRQQDARNYIT